MSKFLTQIPRPPPRVSQHFTDPAKLLEDMMGPAAAKGMKSAPPVAMHALAVIGAMVGLALFTTLFCCKQTS
jgi:hypothetical protein